MVKMIKLMMTTGLAVICLSGCAYTNNNIKKDTKQVRKVVDKIKDDTKRPLLYKGNYELEYNKPRVIWFKPMLTDSGNVLSERTITIAPKKLKWKEDAHKTNMGEKFKKLQEKSKVVGEKNE